jgi:hypothetical protein
MKPGIASLVPFSEDVNMEAEESTLFEAITKQ